jgi:hypothetical protein
MICENCGDTIGAARLRANPHAKCCVDCQESLERQGKFTRHRMSYSVRFKGDEIESMDSILVRGGTSEKGKTNSGDQDESHIDPD